MALTNVNSCLKEKRESGWVGMFYTQDSVTTTLRKSFGIFFGLFYFLTKDTLVLTPLK